MQGSEIAIQQTDSASAPGWLERFTLIEKTPFLFFFGALLGFSSPGFDCAWLAWVGLAPLLVLVRSASNKWEAIFSGLIFGIGYNLVALSWYLGLFPLRWMGLDDWVAVQAVGLVWLLESIHEALLFAAFAWLVFSLPMRAGFLPHIRRPFFPYLICVPLIWVFFHWVVATSEFFLGMPVNQLAYTQHNQLELIQMAKLGGSGLLDFFLVMANCAFAGLLFEIAPLAPRVAPRSDQIAPKVGAWVDIIVVGLILSGFLSWGALSVHRIAWQVRDENEEHFIEQTPAIPIAVLQSNVTIEEDKLGTIEPADVVKRYIQLGTGTGALMLFLPESAIGPKQFAAGMLLSKLKGIVSHEKKEAISGTIEKLDNNLINAARIIAVPQPKDSIYIKQRQAPFGESAPFGALGLVSSQMTASLPGSRSGPDSLVNAHAANLLNSMFGKIGVSISTEVIFPNLVADEVRRGAQLLVNVTNLNRFHQSNLNKQVVAAATLRAVENGRFMVVSTSTGVSAVIDPAGVVTSRAYPNKRGAIFDTVQFLYNRTPFNKMGRAWWL